MIDPPIAWLQLKYQKLQTVAAILSIAFISLLLFMQIGFRGAFVGTLLELPAKLEGDLFLLDSSTTSILNTVQFPNLRLYQIAAFPEIESVQPLYLQGTETPDPSGAPEFFNKVLAVGFPVTQNPLQISEIESQLSLLKEQGVCLFNRLSKKKFDPILQDIIDNGQKTLLIRGGSQLKPITIKGLFPMYISEAFESHLLCSDITVQDIFNLPRDRISLAAIHLKPGQDINQVQQKLNAYLPEDVILRQKFEVLEKERDLFEYKSPMGAAFRAGVLTSELVGIVVLYQLLFQLISKYLQNYATLKALGFSHRMLQMTVLMQAVILALVGYVIGWIGSYFFYDEMTVISGLKHTMTLEIIIQVFVLVFVICLVSAVLTVRKLNEADPADLFG